MDELVTAHAAALEAAVAAWDRRGWPRPRVLLVSGSGLAVDLYPPSHGPEPLAELLPFPVHAIEGHAHGVELILPRPDLPVLYLRGRLHAYQGYDPLQTVFPIRLAALLGARTLVMTNAAGGLTGGLEAGQLVLVRDHLNLTGLSPLRGRLPAAWGPLFPDLSQAYDRRLRRLALARAADLGLALGEGVYAGVAGPSYETPAEVRMLALLGADLVGMSTVLEVIAARHMGLSCLVFSLVSNLGAGVADQPLDHDEVIAAGLGAREDLSRLLRAILEDDAFEN
ncbi:MAG TPA: purine-nucleoside phosphorylase [Thermoanaerobaculia bacterium]|nr:purine-nucleoside phosphorylase [Thermoanaerobaculia bacterium]